MVMVLTSQDYLAPQESPTSHVVSLHTRVGCRLVRGQKQAARQHPGSRAGAGLGTSSATSSLLRGGGSIDGGTEVRVTSQWWWHQRWALLRKLPTCRPTLGQVGDHKPGRCRTPDLQMIFWSLSLSHGPENTTLNFTPL